MREYKIILPITAQVGYLEKCLNSIPDKTKLCVLNNFVNPEVEQKCKELESQGAEVHRFPWNLGAGPSFNFGMKMLDKHSRNLDYVIILSPARFFDKSIEDLVEVIEREEDKEPQYYYNAPSPEHKTDMHSIVFTKKLYEEVGLFDENLWPYGYDDMDMEYRLKLIGKEVKKLYNLPLHSQPLSAGVGSDPRLMQHFQNNVAHQSDYYKRKWGGEHRQEIFKTPFNNPFLTVKDWTLELDQLKMIQL